MTYAEIIAKLREHNTPESDVEAFERAVEDEAVELLEFRVRQERRVGRGRRTRAMREECLAQARVYYADDISDLVARQSGISAPDPQSILNHRRYHIAWSVAALLSRASSRDVHVTVDVAIEGDSDYAYEAVNRALDAGALQDAIAGAGYPLRVVSAVVLLRP